MQVRDLLELLGRVVVYELGVEYADQLTKFHVRLRERV